jgi:hypothetical protein
MNVVIREAKYMNLEPRPAVIAKISLINLMFTAAYIAHNINEKKFGF